MTNLSATSSAIDVFGLRGKPVLVVGGGSGIGRATALLLGTVGANVAVADLDAGRAAEVSAEVAALGVQSVSIAGDVTDPDDAQRVVDDAHAALGGLLAVVNIVGVASWSDLLSMDLAMWESDLRSNLTHHLFVGRAAAKHMIADGHGGRLALVTSISGIFGAPNHAAYGAAKAGAIALARSMANEWAVHGIRVNSVAPDIIATPRVVAGFTERGVTDMNAIVAADGVPMARWGTPDEIAGPLVFLVSDLAGFMTGQNLVVDGGTQSRFPHGGPKPFTPEEASEEPADADG
ncbi:MAG: family oxidoreductase [Ilumatobacteraceae bacterium]|nr:family oxidoreductase [Ilumatobacteraceae bacterium]